MPSARPPTLHQPDTMLPALSVIAPQMSAVPYGKTTSKIINRSIMLRTPRRQAFSSAHAGEARSKTIKLWRCTGSQSPVFRKVRLDLGLQSGMIGQQLVHSIELNRGNGRANRF